MNLHHLQLFFQVAEAGSVTGGAERAAISQPAVSRALAELEASLHQRLFDRGPKGVVLTAAGKALTQYARQIFALEAEAEEALADLRGLQAGRLTIGASTTIGDYLLPASIGKFVAAHPGVELSLEIGNTETVTQCVLDGRYDVGFTEGEVDKTRLTVEPILEDELVIFGAPGHPATQAARLDSHALTAFPFVLREAGSGTRRIVEDRFESANLRPKVICTLGSTAAIKRAVAAGIGLGIASRLALADELTSGTLRVVPSALTFTRQFHKVRLPWRTDSATLRRYLRFLSEDLATRLPRVAS